jgi:hypothetical protein
MAVQKRSRRVSVQEARRACVSGHDRSDQRLDPDNVHDPDQIIGKDREGHLGGCLWERFGQEVRRPHAGFHRAERMFDRLPPLPDGMRVVVEARLRIRTENGHRAHTRSSERANPGHRLELMAPSFEILTAEFCALGMLTTSVSNSVFI